MHNLITNSNTILLIWFFWTPKCCNSFKFHEFYWFFFSQGSIISNTKSPIVYHYLIFNPLFNSSFLNKYGTHYVSEAKMGSYYVQQSMLNRNSYFEMVLNGIDIEVYAGFSAVGSINPSFANQTEAETFQGYVSSCSN